jgi:hypothetical protein
LVENRGISSKKKRPHTDAGRLSVVLTFPTLLQEPQALRAPQVLPEPRGPEQVQVQVREPELQSQPAFALPPSCSQQLQTIKS